MFLLILPNCVNGDMILLIADGLLCLQYPSSGAILIFLPGLAEISSLYEQLNASLCGPKATKK